MPDELNYSNTARPAIEGTNPAHDERGLPAKEAPSKFSLAGDESILTQMRRRKAAALRLPPLADGRRDPMQLYPRDGAA